ncbi:MAG: DUF362 domain-containing protein [Actinobacteria bacterium]|nr:MAG: DUF362 domain-containing protein [Actinomycetota bacterium]
MSALVSPGQTVLLKVNLLSRAAPERAVTTHPEVVRAVIREVVTAGGVPTVGDSPGGPNTPALAARVFEASGIGAVCAAEGVRLTLFDEDVVRVQNPDGALFGAFTIGRAVAEADVVIDLPKLKTHGFMMYTGAVKNLFGCIPGLEKAQYHMKVPAREDFAEMLLDLMLACRPAAAIMDAVVAMEGKGPAGGTPRQVGAVMASTDLVALDVIASAMIGLDPSEVYTNRAAAARGLGPAHARDVETVGADWCELAPRGFALPARDVSAGMPAWLRDHLRRAATARPFLARAADCTRCGSCLRDCPVDAIEVGEGGPSFDHAKCIRCYCCQELCPPQAIDLKTPVLARIVSPRRGRA